MIGLYDARHCELGEGPLWHPLRRELFWFDIISCQMHSKRRSWQFNESVSAAGWINFDELLIATKSQLLRFHVQKETQIKICDLECNDPLTRSNDGRADPYGGFWIGTMGNNAEPAAGAIYRYYRGNLVKLFSNITIPNAICFSPDHKTAYYADTPKKQIMAQELDSNGWPCATPRLAVDMTRSGEYPDGAVVDSSGNIWCAQWGSARVSCYNPEGKLLHQEYIGATNVSCPAFAGDSSRLFCTSARQGISAENVTSRDGQTFETQVNATGQLEYSIEI